jgi:hypothetical protein
VGLSLYARYFNRLVCFYMRAQSRAEVANAVADPVRVASNAFDIK